VYDLFPTIPSLAQATQWITEDHTNLMIDLAPYMTRCAHTLQSDASMARAHHLFVTAGLRSLPILSTGSFLGTNEIVGIVTRIDLLEDAYHQGEMCTCPQGLS
jgi:CBS-domain-containing membrane protein